MVKLWDLMDKDLYRQMLVEKYIRLNKKGGLTLINYTEKAQFDQLWNEVTSQCRGLVIDRGFNVLARPFDKFQNYAEADAALMDFQVEVTDKMDGSLGILFHQNNDPYDHPDHMSASSMRYAMAWHGTWHCATRGSFDSDQAEEMRKILSEKYDGLRLDGNWTYMFEIIYPGNRIVLDYEDARDLYLLGARNNHTGAYKAAEDIPDWPGPRTETFAYVTLRQALEAPPRKNAEGYVIYFPDLDYRVKLKQDDYVALHKIVTGLTERRVWENMKEGKTLEDLLEIVPDEWHLWLKEAYYTILTNFNAIKHYTWIEYCTVRDRVGEDADRKTFAEEAKTMRRPGLIFALLDGKDISDKIWDEIRPTAE